MRAAVSGWSPVIMTVRMPARRASATESRTSVRGGSMMPTMPVQIRSFSMTSLCSAMSETSPEIRRNVATVIDDLDFFPDLSVVEHISDTVGVMYLGNLVEYGTKERVFARPLHPYTEALFSAIPTPDPDVKMNRIILEGSIPSPANPPAGCKFHTRCSRCMERCKVEAPAQREVEPGHYVVCHLYDQ